MIFFILSAGLILRLISLNQSLWLDEATTSNVASNLGFGEIIIRFSPNDFHPPLYYLLMKFWINIFGNSEVALRIPSVLFGVATIYLVYLIGKEIMNKNTGLMAAGLLATSGLSIYYSQEARMYSFTAFLVSFLVFSLVKTINRGRVGNWILFAVLLGITAMTDYVAILIIPVFWIYAYSLKQKVSWWKKFVMSHIILVLLFTFWFPIFILQIKSGLLTGATSPLWYQILGQTSIKNLALIPIKFMIGRISFDNKWLYGMIVFLPVFLFSFLISKAFKKNLLIWLWLLVPIGLGAIIGLKIPTLYYFRFLFCLPALYLLTAIGIGKIGKYKNITLIAVLSLNLLTSGFYLLSPRFHREDWRAAASAIGSDKIVFPSDSQKEALTYYGKSSQIVNPSQLGKNDKEIWLSRYVWEIFDPSDAARLKIEGLGYNKSSEASFNGVVFWKYHKK